MPDISQSNHSPLSSNRTIAFISYSSADRRYLDELRSQLAFHIRRWNLKVWDNSQIVPGSKWREEIDKALKSAKVALLLLSPDYFASDDIANHELPTLLKFAKEEEVILLCVILRLCPFEDSDLAEFQSINPPSRPLEIMSSAQRNKVWNEVAERVRRILTGEQERNTPTPLSTHSTGSATPAPVSNTAANSSNPSPFGPRSGPASTNSVAGTTQPTCDICILCAMEEEVKAFMFETTRLYQATFQSTTGPQTKRDYRYTTIQNNKGESLTLYVTWPPRYGPQETSLHFKDALRELKPRFTAMTGICAGNRDQVALGDIIVAERAFDADAGKIILDKRQRKQQLYDTRTYEPDSDILHFVRMFDAWESAASGVKRPISKRQQRDWLLSTLLQDATPRVDDIPSKELKRYVPQWKSIMSELQRSTPRYLTDDGALIDKAVVRQLFYTQDFPYTDPKRPRRFIAPMASGSAVRSDHPFEEIRKPVRGTLAYDMEGATFYRVVAEFTGIRALLVKGVSDYADPYKDDSYHEYAAAVSAIYILSFIKEFLNSERF